MGKEKELIDFIYSLIRPASFSRLGKVFRTKNFGYFYDTGTGKVLQCEENVYKILEQLENENFIYKEKLEMSDEDFLEALVLLKECIDHENILKAIPVKKFVGNQVDNLREMLDHHVSYICLEVTQRCNLRCRYCVYQDYNSKFRSFDCHDMDFETAKKAIDYIFLHSVDEELHFGFYGGEPLLKFNLIKECVDYIQRKADGKKIYYTFTTNATLMTPERARYFASIPNFSILFSIDGPEDIHNQNRKMLDGTGSFEQTMKGFYYALDAYGEKNKDRLMINSVISPPYNDLKFERMQEFYETNARGVQSQYSYVDEGPKEMSEDKISTPVFDWMINSDVKNKKRMFPWAGAENAFLTIHNRPLCDEPISTYRFNGCCVPGSRRLYVTVDGKFKVCERIGNSPDIGNVETGLDYDAIKKYYVDEYMKKSVEDCNSCWMVNLCKVCYANCFDSYGINLLYKRQICQTQRYLTQKSLAYYHAILEEDAESLEYLNDIVII